MILRLEFHKRLAFQSIDLGLILAPLINPAFIRHGRRERAADEGHGRVAGVRAVAEHESLFLGKSLQFVELGQKNRALPLKEISDSSIRKEFFSEQMERRLGICSVHDQAEFSMSPVSLFTPLLIGGMEKIPYVEHSLSSLVREMLSPGI